MLARSESGWGLHSARFAWANLRASDTLQDLFLFFSNARLILMKRRSGAENSVFRKKSIVLSLRSGGRPRISWLAGIQRCNANHDRVRLSFYFVNDWAPPFRFPD